MCAASSDRLVRTLNRQMLPEQTPGRGATATSALAPALQPRRYPPCLSASVDGHLIVRPAKPTHHRPTNLLAIRVSIGPNVNKVHAHHSMLRIARMRPTADKPPLNP